ncbi:MAG TPA: M28 family peptidase [Pseudonocardia sp.]|jgi:aminopeptidase S|uniref:M28 family peptidase n=1 Tax=Pseudonocardia sp. TaxID=60912 RepID=UPI002C39C5BC|nr:M28 family peptidase [Pseudonocardia sp.]HTF51373.1 M28 family peptidase [Pseudonocardia sp.]
MRTAWGAALAASAALVLAGCAATGTPPPSAPNGQSPLQSGLVTEVTGAGAFTHLEALQRIADQNGGNRATPGPGYDASVDYVARVLREAGYEVSTPTFTFEQDGDSQGSARNVIAQTKTGNPDHVVFAGAHLDSVPEGPGINDNASGVGSLLEIATRLGGSPEVTNAVRFGFWGLEEEDLNGSTAYVEELSRAERDKIALYLNVDMVASPNAGYFVQAGEESESESDSPPEPSAVSRVLVDQLATTGISPQLVGFDGGSDFVPFVDARIPTLGVMTGDAGRKSGRQAEQWGGRAGEVFDRCYHQSCDRVDNIDRPALDRFSDALAGSLVHFASSADMPARR